MKRYQTYTPLQQVLSAELNGIQDRALGILTGTTGGGYTQEIASTCVGMIGAITQHTGVTATATLSLIDSGNDWRDRVIWGSIWLTTVRIGQGTDINLNDTSLAIPQVNFMGYTGIGAYSNITTGAAVANGAIPLNGAGAFRSYAVTLYAEDVTLTATRAWLYCDPTSGALYLYNNMGASTDMVGFVMGSGDTGLR